MLTCAVLCCTTANYIVFLSVSMVFIIQMSDNSKESCVAVASFCLDSGSLRQPPVPWDFVLTGAVCSCMRLYFLALSIAKMGNAQDAGFLSWLPRPTCFVAVTRVFVGGFFRVVIVNAVSNPHMAVKPILQCCSRP